MPLGASGRNSRADRERYGKPNLGARAKRHRRRKFRTDSADYGRALGDALKKLLALQRALDHLDRVTAGIQREADRLSEELEQAGAALAARWGQCH